MRGLAFTLTSVIVLSALNASADDKPAPAAAALLDQGRKAADAGDWETACLKFAESHLLDPTPGALLSLADCEEKLGHVATAWLKYRKAVDTLPPKDPRLPAAKRKVAALEERLPWLTVRLAPGAPADAVVKRDGEQIGTSLVGVPVPVDPGKHVVVVTAPGRTEKWYDVPVSEKESRELLVEPGPGPGAPAAPAGPKREAPPAAPEPASAKPAPAPIAPALDKTPLPREDEDESGSGLRTGGYVAMGVGIVAVIAGAVTRGLAFGQKATMDDHCNANKFCDQTGLDAISKIDTFQTLSTAAFIVGGVGIVGGTSLLVAGSKRSGSQARVQPMVLPGGAGLSFGRSF